jgi:hypothetical protein
MGLNKPMKTQLLKKVIAIHKPKLFLGSLVTLTSYLLVKWRTNDPSFDQFDSAIFSRLMSHRNLLSWDSGLLATSQYVISYIANLVNEPTLVDFSYEKYTLNEFTKHAYLSLIWLKPLTLFFAPKSLIAVFSAAYLIVPLFLAFLITKKEENNTSNHKFFIRRLTITFIVALPILLFPGYYAAPTGQFYPDRLFLILFPIFLYLIELRDQNRAHNWHIWLLGFLCITISERASLFVGIIATINCVRYLRAGTNKREFLKTPFIYLGVGGIFWTGIYTQLISNNRDNARYTTDLLNFWKQPEIFLSKDSLRLILVSMPLLFALRKNSDLLALSLISLVPNLLGTVGGAEKTGWYNHYLTYVSGVLIGSYLVCISRNIDYLIKKRNTLLDRRVFHGQKVSIIFSILVFLFINPFNSQRIIEPPKAQNLGVYTYLPRWYFEGSFRTFQESQNNEIASLLKRIPPNSRVVVTESSSVFFINGNQNLVYFPANLNTNDFLFIQTRIENQKFNLPDVLSYQGAIQVKNLNKLVGEIVNSSCYSFLGSTSVNQYSLFKRNKEFTLEECVQ